MLTFVLDQKVRAAYAQHRDDFQKNDGGISDWWTPIISPVKLLK